MQINQIVNQKVIKLKVNQINHKIRTNLNHHLILIQAINLQLFPNLFLILMKLKKTLKNKKIKINKNLTFHHPSKK